MSMQVATALINVKLHFEIEISSKFRIFRRVLMAGYFNYQLINLNGIGV